MDPSPKCVVRGLRQEELALEKDAARHVPKPLGGSPESRGGPPGFSRGSPSALKNTYSRATQGGSGSGRRASRWRLQSSSSPRQRQGAGHGSSAATPLRGSSAGPARPSTAHSNSPNAVAGARKFGAPIAVLRPLARPCAPQPARTRSPAQISSYSGCPRSGPRVRTLFSRSQVNSFLLVTPAKPFHALKQREGNRKGRSAAAELQNKQRRCAETVSRPQKKLFLRLPAAERQVPARRSRGAGRAVADARPLANQAPVCRGHVTITGL